MLTDHFGKLYFAVLCAMCSEDCYPIMETGPKEKSIAKDTQMSHTSGRTITVRFLGSARSGFLK